MSFTYAYARPALTVDCVVFAKTEGRIQILLIERGNEPFLGHWALPGGFVDMDETCHAAARRELEEETSLELAHLQQLGIFDAVNRDPRGRTLSVAYVAFAKAAAVRGQDDASDARWVNIDALPALAFDHAEIIALALDRFPPEEQSWPA